MPDNIRRLLHVMQASESDTHLAAVLGLDAQNVNLKMSLQGRISIIKMNVHGLNFLFSIPPLPPPTYFDELHSLTSKFIWNGKRACIRLCMLQHSKSSGGFGVPDFRPYYWSFQIKLLTTWCNEEATTPWQQIEQELVKPHNLADVLFCKTWVSLQ